MNGFGRRVFRVLALAGLVAATAASAHAAEAPLWEFGMGVGGLSFPVYRGADQRRDFPVPLPYFVYRGDFLKADRKGVRGELIDRAGFELNISGSASLPVGSGEVAARRGMADLKPTVGVGPSLGVELWESANQRQRLSFQLPVRANFTAQRDSRFVGWETSPRLNLDVDAPAGFDGWKLGLLAGPLYGSRRAHEYFYTVTPADATAGRAAYDARGGYAGLQVLGSLSKRFPRYWVGGFVRYDTLHGAAFADSPLVRDKRYLAAGFGIAWLIGESSRRVASDD